MVVCGAGLTLLQCGGRYADRQGGTDTGDGDESGSSQGGAAGKPSKPPSGMAGTLAMAGSPSSSGGAGVSQGGGVASGGSSPSKPPVPTKPPGPTEQWVCDLYGSFCNNELFSLDESICFADPSRPVAPEDCKGSSVFTCVRGLLGDTEVNVACACTAPPPDGSCPCPDIPSDCDARLVSEPMCNPFISMCGCAITCILK